MMTNNVYCYGLLYKKPRRANSSSSAFHFLRVSAWREIQSTEVVVAGLFMPIPIFLQFLHGTSTSSWQKCISKRKWKLEKGEIVMVVVPWRIIIYISLFMYLIICSWSKCIFFSIYQFTGKRIPNQLTNSSLLLVLYISTFLKMKCELPRPIKIKVKIIVQMRYEWNPA